MFRGAYQAIPIGQSEAAQAIGLGDGQVSRLVLVPQMIRVAFPSMGNVFVDIVKDTAILSVIGVSELMRETQRWAQFYFRSFEFYTAAGVIYFVIVLAVTALWRFAERRLSVHLDTYGPLPRRRRWRTYLAMHERLGSDRMSEARVSRPHRPGDRGRRGIGEAIVERLVAEGAAVVVADRLADAAEGVAAGHRDAGAEAIAHAVDLTDLDAIAAMVDFAIAWRGGLDILVNNAGVAIARSVLEATPDEWQAQLDVNLRAPFFALQAAARHMVERGSGKIVNTVSTSGFASSSTPNRSTTSPRAGCAS